MFTGKNWFHKLKCFSTQPEKNLSLSQNQQVINILVKIDLIETASRHILTSNDSYCKKCIVMFSLNIFFWRYFLNARIVLSKTKTLVKTLHFQRVIMDALAAVSIFSGMGLCIGRIGLGVGGTGFRA